jgi:hypothetical protein
LVSTIASSHSGMDSLAGGRHAEKESRIGRMEIRKNDLLFIDGLFGGLTFAAGVGPGKPP